MGVGDDQWHHHEDGERLYEEAGREKERIREGILWRGPVDVPVVN